MRKLAVLVAAVALAGCGNTTKNTTNVTVVAPPASGGLVAYRVPAGSMEPTLRVGESVYVEPGRAPQVGNIIVFHPPTAAQETEGGGAAKCGPVPHVVADGSVACDMPVPTEASTKFVKRIVAGPGDEIFIREGHVFRKGPHETTFKREADSYIKPCVEGDPKCNFPTPIKIPVDHWFTLGDNRGESDDSRFWGPVPTSWIVGVTRWCGSVRRACAGS